MKIRFKLATILAVALAAAIHSSNAQIITNGSFEAPDTPTFSYINAGQTTISPWVVGLTGVDLGDAVGNGFIVGPAFDGTQYVDLDGSPGPGQLTQAFATTPGFRYAVTFAYANNYINTASASANVRLFDGMGDRLNENITHTSSVSGNLNWTVFNGEFTALESTTSFEITSLSGSGSQGGILLDAVAVQIVPGPPATALALGGFDLNRGGASGILNDSNAELRQRLSTTFGGSTFTASGSLTAGYLETLQVLILGVASGSQTAVSPLNSGEKAALLDFVENGGACVMFLDNNIQFEAASDSMASVFGVDTSGVVPGSEVSTVTATTHPVTNGFFGTATGFPHQSFPGALANIGTHAVALSTLSNGQISSAAIAPGALGPGSGGVLFFCDSVQVNGAFTAGIPVMVENFVVWGLGPSAPPLIRIAWDELNPIQLRVDFTAVLQSSMGLTGFIDVTPQPESPYRFIPTANRQFFRVRATAP